MKAVFRTNDEPPGILVMTEANAVDDDTILAQRYVRDVVFNSQQRKLMRDIEGDPALFERASGIVQLPEKRQRNHPLYCEIRSNEERLIVKNFMHYFQLTLIHTQHLKGAHGERLRREWQVALSQGKG